MHIICEAIAITVQHPPSLCRYCNQPTNRTYFMMVERNVDISITAAKVKERRSETHDEKLILPIMTDRRAVCAARTPRRQHAGCPADSSRVSPYTAAFSCRGNKQPTPKPSPTISKKPVASLMICRENPNRYNDNRHENKINTVTSQN